MDLFTYLLAKNDKFSLVHKSDLFAYLLGKNNSIPLKTAEGVHITIEALKTKINELKMTKESSQVTTTGKNLLYIKNGSKISNGITGVWENGILTYRGKATSTYAGITEYTTKKLSPGTYTFSIDHSVDVQVRFRYKSDTSHDVNIPIGSTSTTFTITEDTERMYIFINSLTVDKEYNEVIKCMVESSPTPTDFEPYTGGEASPSPDYPQEVEVVEGYIKDGNNYVDVKVTGKNLFNPNASIINQTGLNSDGTTFGSGVSSVYNYMRVKPNTTYTLSGGIDTTHTKRICMYSEENEVSFVSTVSARGILITFTTTSTTNYIRIQFKTNELNSMQLEQGSIATSYEPYKESIVPIPLNGNFIAGIGDYKDTLIVDKFGKCYLNKKIAKVVFVGTEDGWSGNSPETGVYRFIRTLNGSHNVGNARNKDYIMSNYFRGVIDNSIGGMYQYQTQIYFNMDSSICSSVDEFKTWLSTHNTDVYYVLEQEELIDLNYTVDLKLFKGVNNISNSEDMMMTLKYY